MAMENLEGLTPEELKELIQEQLKELGVDTDTVEIEVIDDGPAIALRGKVSSRSEREMIKQTITDVVGIDDITDELVVIRGANDDPDYEEPSEEGEQDFQEEEDMGTEDVSQSVEDGIPYIPPTNPTYQGSPEAKKWKRKNKKEK